LKTKSLFFTRIYQLYVYDPETGKLHYKQADGNPDQVVKPIGHDVCGEDLIVVDGCKIPIYFVANALSSFDPETIKKYPNKQVTYYPGHDIPSQDRMKELFEYDSTQGALIHKLHRQGVEVGTVAGSKSTNSKKPLAICIDGFKTTVHRVLSASMCNVNFLLMLCFIHFWFPKIFYP